METAPLKSFATWARTALIREVTARIAVVLAPASPERIEQPKAVHTLEKAVHAAGGGEKGRAAVADRVAYTWFNRIIALRFMDANGYTGIGVVSPQTEVEAGQPEILAEAKRGNIDAAVVGTKTRETVTGLVNGTRRSEDPQGEAYALLLAAYCRHWYRAMPFMFEREGDFTELLIPANLLADDSVLNRAVKVLTVDVCQDVEVIGWLYQFYISERKDEIFADFKKNKKAGAAEIPAATQLFTPHWIVRYLVENSLGRLWMLNRPSSRLIDQMEYYIAPVDEETDFLKISGPEELKVMDPACGSGHMLTYAFDLLYAIYEEEGYSPPDIPSLILSNNLYGTEIDPRAGALAAFALTMKARARQRTFFNKRVEPNICVLEPIHFKPQELDFLLTATGDRDEDVAFWNKFEHADTFGSLIRSRKSVLAALRASVEAIDTDADLLASDVVSRAKRVIRLSEALSSRYSVVVANPPYMGSSNMSEQLSGWLALNYPLSKSDLMTAFMERAQDLTRPRGVWGMINLPSWMFLTSFESLRRSFLRSVRFESLLHLGRGVFGSDFGSVAFVVCNSAHAPGHRGLYRRLFENHVDVRPVDKIRSLFLDKNYGVFRADQASFLGLPGAPIAYWLSERMVQIFDDAIPLSRMAEVKHGLSTGKNTAVVRLWWEVSLSDFGRGYSSVAQAHESENKWFPYNKGGNYRRWYGNFEYVLRYDMFGIQLMSTFSGHRHDGKSHYFKEGITWTFVTSALFAARYTPVGSVFDVSGSSLFSDEPKVLLGFLCSDLASEFLKALNPTINFQVGNIKSLPILASSIRQIRDLIEPIVNRAIAIHVEDWDSFETSWDYQRDGLVTRHTRGSLRDSWKDRQEYWASLSEEAQDLENQNNRIFRSAYGLEDDYSHRPAHETLSLRRTSFEPSSAIRELISYAVGCMFGRYSLDVPGLILADQGVTVRDYLAKVPTPTFMPDTDNVIPIVDGDWFEDDIVAKFRQFLRVAFGEGHFEENLRFVTESLGVKDLRDYFAKSFYKDHVQRYKKRPIYWLVSSPKGSFNALIYMHRYTPSTVSTVLNEYLREYKAKLASSLQQQERLAAGGGTPREQAVAQKEADRLRKVLLELDDYEHDILYPLASRQLAIDLDDGVKVNYAKFGEALKKIPGLEASDE
jgi:Eco57I restriction-modification methylase